MMPAAAPQLTAGTTDLTALADASIDGMVLLDLERRCLYASAAARGLFHEDGRDLAGSDFISLFPPTEHAMLRAHIGSLRNGEGTCWSSILRDAGGFERSLECRLERSARDERMLLAVVRDVSETRQLVRKTNAVARIAASVAYAGTVEATLHSLARTLVEVTGLHACTVFLLGEDGKSNMSAIYGMPDDVLDRLRIIWSEGASPLSEAAIEEGKTVIIRDVPRILLQNPRFTSIYDYLQVAPWDTMVAVPLLYGGRALGILSGHYTPGAPPGTADVAFLNTIAHQTAVAVENARLAAEAQERAISEERRHSEAQVREKDALYRSIFQSTSDALMIADNSGHVVEVNPAFCRMYGLDYDEVVSYPHPVLTEDTMQTVRETGVSEEHVVNQRKDGSPLHLQARATVLTYEGEPHFLLVAWDVTERVLAYELLEQRVEKRTRELETLLDVSQTVASTLELRPLLDLILDQLKTVVDYEGSSIMEFDGEFLEMVRNTGPQIPGDSPAFRFAVKNVLPVWDMLVTGQPIIIDDVQADTPAAGTYRRVNGIPHSITEGSVRSWLAVPLMLKGTTVGTLSCSHREPHHYGPRHAKLATAIARQAAVAMENARLYEQAQKMATLEERQRLARELHDSVSQALFGIGLGARTARILLERDPVQAIESVDYVLSLAQAGMAEMRALIFELRPESLENEGLVSALEKQAAAISARHELHIDTVLCDEPDVSLPVKEALYRIAQEALHNAVKHAEAGRARVSLRCTAGEVIIDIEDNGRGFDSHASFPGHLGLHSMRERAVRLGGTVELESAAGQGTHVLACVPIRATATR
jgi:PAS domain S-box-containing protein